MIYLVTHDNNTNKILELVWLCLYHHLYNFCYMNTYIYSFSRPLYSPCAERFRNGMNGEKG